MELTLNKSVIKQMVKGFTKVKPRFHSIPILEHARFQVKAKTLTVMVTDLEQELTFSTPEIIQETCSEEPFLVPLDELKDLAKGKGDELVKFEVDAGGPLIITTLVGGVPLARTVSTLTADEFPRSLSPNVKAQPCDLAELADRFKRASLSAADKKHDRYVLRGVLFSGKSEPKALVGTDGRRMAVLYMPELPLDDDVIIPNTKVLSSDLLADAEGKMGFHTDASGDIEVLVLETERWRYVVRRVIGTYPNWPTIIPHYTWDTRIEFSPESIEVVEAACKALPDNDAKDHGILLHATQETVLLLSEDTNGFSHVAIPNTKFNGDSVTFNVNRLLLLDAFRSGFNVLHITKNPAKPMRVEGDVSGLYVLMPCTHSEPTVSAVRSYLRQITLNTPIQGDAMDNRTGELYNARADALFAWSKAKAVRTGTMSGTVSDKEFAELTRKLENAERSYYDHLECSKPTEAITPTKENTMAKKKSRAERKADKAAASTAAESNIKVDAAEAKHAKAQAKVAAKADKKDKAPAKAEKKAKPEPKAKAEDNAEALTSRYRREYTMYEAIAAGKKPMTADQVIEASNALYVKNGGTDNLGQAKHVWGITSKVLVHCGAVAYADGKYSIA